MASLTRSDRQFEGLPSPQFRSRGRSGSIVGCPLTRSRPAVFQHNSSGGPGRGGAGRTKRGLDASERDLDAIKPKRARIAVEILAKPPPITNDTSRVPPSRPRSSGATVETLVRPPHILASPRANAPTTARRQQQHAAPLTKHQEKVQKGIRHELDRLQPQAVDTKEQPGRKLRSQEATRFKSDLSAYFPDYDEVVGNDPKEHRTC